MNPVRTIGGVTIGPGIIIEHRRDLSLCMMHLLSRWPFIESQIGTTLVNILGDKAAPVIEEMIRRANSQGQRALLLEHATPLLTAENQERLNALLSMFGQDFKVRNRFAHWLSGISKHEPDAILLVNPSTVWRHATAAHQSNRPLQSFPENKVYKYRRQDLERIDQQFGETTTAFSLFQHALSELPQLRARVLPRLHALPRFRQALEQLRAGSCQDQSTPEEPQG